MINEHVPKLGIVHNTALVMRNRYGIDAGGYRPSRIDFGLDFIRDCPKTVLEVRVRSIFSNWRIGEDFNSITMSRGRVTRSTGIESRARRVYMFAKAFGRIWATGQIWHTCFVGDELVLLNKFINTGVTTSITWTSNWSGTIEKVLNRKVDFIILQQTWLIVYMICCCGGCCKVTSNLDPIS